MVDINRIFRCVSCGTGTVRPTACPGRTTHHSFLDDLPVPEDLVVPTCDQCGEEFFDMATAKMYDRAMRPVVQAVLRRQVAELLPKVRAKLSCDALARALAVDVMRLYKIETGKATIPVGFVNLLAALSTNPKRIARAIEAAHQIRGAPCES